MSSKKTIKRKDETLARAVAARIIQDARKESGPSALVAKRQRKRRSERKSNQSGQGQLTAAPSAMSRAMRFHPSRPQRTIVKSMDEVATIVSPAGDTMAVTSFRVNPANAVLFPYLSVQAKQWEFYRFKKLRFMYVTRCATDKNGILLLSPDYDNRDASPAAANDFALEQELMNTKDAVQDSVWKDVICDLDPKMMYSQGPRKKVSDSLMYDRDLYDSAVMRVAVRGEESAFTAGALFVEYECEFMVPSQPEQTAFGETFQGMFCTKTSVQNLTSGVPANIEWDGQWGDGIGLSRSGGLFTATAKSKWLVTVDATLAGSTVASAFNAKLYVTGTTVAETVQEVSYPTDTGAHKVAITSSAIVELGVGGVLSLAAEVTAAATATVQTATVSIIPY
jgi:hypothetical protein